MRLRTRVACLVAAGFLCAWSVDHASAAAFTRAQAEQVFRQSEPHGRIVRCHRVSSRELLCGVLVRTRVTSEWWNPMTQAWTVTSSEYVWLRGTVPIRVGGVAWREAT